MPNLDHASGKSLIRCALWSNTNKKEWCHHADLGEKVEDLNETSHDYLSQIHYLLEKASRSIHHWFFARIIIRIHNLDKTHFSIAATSYPTHTYLLQHSSSSQNVRLLHFAVPSRIFPRHDPIPTRMKMEEKGTMSLSVVRSIRPHHLHSNRRETLGNHPAYVRS